MRALARYAETNAIARALLSELLTEARFAELIRAPSLRDAWALLRGTCYEAVSANLPEPDPVMVNVLLRRANGDRFRRSIRGLRGAPRAVGQVLMSRWELDDLERVLRLWHGNKQALDEHVPSFSPFSSLPLQDIAVAGTMGEIAAALRRTPYCEPIRGGAETYQAESSLFYVEMALEKDYYARLLTSLARLGRPDAVKVQSLVAAEIDLVNLSWLARLRGGEAPEKSIRAGLIPGPSRISKALAGSDLSAGSLAEASRPFIGGMTGGEGQAALDLERIAFLELTLAEMAAGTARRLLADFPFSISCVVAFYLLSRLELRDLSTVFAGKAIGAGESEIRERLFSLG